MGFGGFGIASHNYCSKSFFNNNIGPAQTVRHGEWRPRRSRFMTIVDAFSRSLYHLNYFGERRVKSSSKRYFPKVSKETKETNQNLRHNQITFMFMFTFIPCRWDQLFESFLFFPTLTIRTFTPQTLISLQITSTLVFRWPTTSPISFHSYFMIIYLTVSLLYVSSRRV